MSAHGLIPQTKEWWPLPSRDLREQRSFSIDCRLTSFATPAKGRFQSEDQKQTNWDHYLVKKRARHSNFVSADHSEGSGTAFRRDTANKRPAAQIIERKLIRARSAIPLVLWGKLLAILKVNQDMPRKLSQE